jgi:hypothetical protein
MNELPMKPLNLSSKLQFLKMGARSALLCLVFFSSTTVFAWGPHGHELIAELADSLLTSSAKEETLRLLSLEPGQTLKSISTWADEHRTKDNAKWHFINFPRHSCSFQKERDCNDGECAIEALEKKVAVLSNKSAAPEDRLNALKFVVHIMGDIHQPLHAGFPDDKGGNQYQVQLDEKSTNLHAFWDNDLITRSNLSRTKYIEQLMQIHLHKDPRNTKFSDAAEESCEIVHSANFYPSRMIEKEYIEYFSPVLNERLSLAGQRLANLLNQVLSN